MGRLTATTLSRSAARAKTAADRGAGCCVILIRTACLLAAHAPLMLVFRAGWMNITFQVTARAATRRTTDGARGAQFMNAPVGQVNGLTAPVETLLICAGSVGAHGAGSS